VPGYPPFEFSGVELCIGSPEPFLICLRDLGRCKRPAVGRHRDVVLLGDLTAFPDLSDELHRRLKEVCIESEFKVELVKPFQGRCF